MQPIKLKSNLKSLFLSQNYNSDGKLNKKDSHLNALFNNEIPKNKNNINVNKSMKKPIRLKELKTKTNLSFKNDTNKKEDFNSSKINTHIDNKIYHIKNELENEDKLDNDLKLINIREKEIKNYIFFHNDKLENILFNKKKKKSHEKTKDFKLKIKNEKNSEINNINNRYNYIDNNNYENKQLSTDVNISENDKNKKIGLSPFKLNFNINNNNKYFSSKCIDKYNYFKEKNANIVNKKNNDNNILPLLKSSSFKRNHDI